jgi:xylulokinase
LLAAAGIEPVQQVRVAGGGAKSTLWRQILADILGVELVTVATTEGAAYGAALLAGVGVGAWPDVASACGAAVQPGTYTTPDQRTSAVYEELYATYRELYPALKGTNDALAALESRNSE